jgi:hypothetical protein
MIHQIIFIRQFMQLRQDSEMVSTNLHTAVVVVGGGVNGLCAAVRLLERGFVDVTLIAERMSGIPSKTAPAVFRPDWLGATEVGWHVPPRAASCRSCAASSFDLRMRVCFVLIRVARHPIVLPYCPCRSGLCRGGNVCRDAQKEVQRTRHGANACVRWSSLLCQPQLTAECPSVSHRAIAIMLQRILSPRLIFFVEVTHGWCDGRRGLAHDLQPSRVVRWGNETKAHLQRVYRRDGSAAGVTSTTHIEVFRPGHVRKCV